MGDFEQLNARRKKIANLMYIGFAVLAFGVILFLALSEVPGIGLMVAVASVIIMIVAGIKFSTLNKEFKSKYLPNLIEEILPGSNFDPRGGISKERVYSSNFLKKADRFTTGDLIIGKIDDVSFATCDLKLEERHVRHTKNGTQVYYVAYFTGRFFEFDFPKSFIGQVITTEQAITTWFSRFKKIELESIDYNAKFKTYTDNEHSAFYILTPHLMESIMNLERRNPGSIALSFHGSTLSVGINNSRDTFELNMFKEINPEVINSYKRDLLVIKEIVQELKLNRNIFKN